MMMLERLIRALQAGGAVFMTMEQAMKEWLARQAGAEGGGVFMLGARHWRASPWRVMIQ